MSTFFSFFIMATALSSIGMLFILLIKKGLKNHITARWQYNIGLLFFALLSVPLIPSGVFASLNMGHWFGTLGSERGTIANTTAAVGEIAGGTYGMDGFQNFAISVDRFVPGYTFVILMGIWVAGIIVSAVIVLLCNKNLRLIKESVKPIENKEVISLFIRCKREVGVKSNVTLGSSILVKTPMTIGFFKAFIILPATDIPLNDMRYAMLHELTHCKNKDIQINSLMCLFQVLYWFNPLVYFAFKQMRLDRELACDASVLGILPKESHIGYGVTLLNFVKSLSALPGIPGQTAREVSGQPVLTFAVGIGDSKPHIIRRVKHIASYTRESGLLRLKSIFLFSLVLLLILCKVPVISVLASGDDGQFNFTADNVQYADLSYFFGSFEGSFVLYDVGAGSYTIHNRDMSVTRVSPTSTYKIFSALIALETGVLEEGNTQREWDETVHPFEAWNQNHNLLSAMHSSATWYFQDLDAEVGMERLSFYLTQLSYGNRNLSGGIADFWIESSLRISPVEQVQLLASLYRNNTVFQEEHASTVMNVLRLSERDGATLSGKTGTGMVNGSLVNGWFIGYVETDGNTFVFATYIQGEDNAGGSVAAQITISILESKGIY